MVFLMFAVSPQSNYGIEARDGEEVALMQIMMVCYDSWALHVSMIYELHEVVMTRESARLEPGRQYIQVACHHELMLV